MARWFWKSGLVGQLFFLIKRKQGLMKQTFLMQWLINTSPILLQMSNFGCKWNKIRDRQINKKKLKMKYNEQKRFGKVVKKLDWGVTLLYWIEVLALMHVFWKKSSAVCLFEAARYDKITKTRWPWKKLQIFRRKTQSNGGFSVVICFVYIYPHLSKTKS